MKQRTIFSRFKGDFGFGVKSPAIFEKLDITEMNRKKHNCKKQKKEENDHILGILVSVTSG